MDNARAIGREMSNPLLFDQLDEDRREAVLDRVGAESEDDRFVVRAGGASDRGWRCCVRSPIVRRWVAGNGYRRLGRKSTATNFERDAVMGTSFATSLASTWVESIELSMAELRRASRTL